MPSRRSFLVPLNDWYPAREVTQFSVSSARKDSMIEIISEFKDAAGLFKRSNSFRIERPLTSAKERAMLPSRRGEWWGCKNKVTVCAELVVMRIVG